MVSNQKSVVCPKCKGNDIDVLTCGSTICHNKKCMYLGLADERLKKHKIYKDRVIGISIKKKVTKNDN